MTVLEFLQPEVAAGGPVALSPMHHDTVAAGARLQARHGWQVAADFGDAAAEARAAAETVAWADVSHLGVVEVLGASALSLPGAPALELGTAVLADGLWWCPVTAQRTFVLGDHGGDEVAAARDRLAAAGDLRVLDLTTAHGALLVTGPQARETIARFCALDLRPHVAPPASFLPGSVARTAGHLLVEAPDRFRLLFGSAYGSYLWTVVADAAGHLGGRAAGADALTTTASTEDGADA